ncbi:nuclear transport factor 2 family protein [Shewanella holmiensis]|uniref:Nuclear transport factor 2 family protein n=1 Tax=Shewanella holmiensis TaxID=2952222 RepID=A0A9X2WNB2_9GAMM|nr:nuclear transport factor 2 family protein [Shewanella holmiensis]MCT7942281.1 nuclear transport factor 2 family protein [Shewanella holmiensis]
MAKLIWVVLIFGLGFTVQANEKSQMVAQFVEAFNERDPELMGQMVTKEAYWFDVTRAGMTSQTTSRDELVKSMKDYFADANRAHSRVIKSVTSGDFVSTVEQVSWQQEGEWLSRCSIGVYLFEAQKIAAVWYYKAHKCDASD